MHGINSQIYEEASEWIVQHRSLGLDADARRRFDAWLRQSPLHVRAYLEISAVWEDVPALDANWNASADDLTLRALADSNVHSLGVESRQGAPDRSTVEQPRARLSVRLFASLAATVVLAAGVGGWLYLQRGVYATSIGEQRGITLADGSNIELNVRSKIRVRYTESERTVELLRGQALFRVAKDAARPFVVESDHTFVRAVGTQFDVNRKSAGTIVTVVEGRVAVLRSAPPAGASTGHDPDASGSAIAPEVPVIDESSQALRARRAVDRSARTSVAAARREEAVYLSAGEQLLIVPQASTTPKATDVAAATAWTQQRLVFDFATLTEVAEELNRYGHRRLVIEDPGLRDFHVSGSFSSTDPTLLLQFLRTQPGIAVHETAEEIRISRRPTSSE